MKKDDAQSINPPTTPSITQVETSSEKLIFIMGKLEKLFPLPIKKGLLRALVHQPLLVELQASWARFQISVPRAMMVTLMRAQQLNLFEFYSDDGDEGVIKQKINEFLTENTVLLEKVVSTIEQFYEQAGIIEKFIGLLTTKKEQYFYNSLWKKLYPFITNRDVLTQAALSVTEFYACTINALDESELEKFAVEAAARVQQYYKKNSVGERQSNTNNK